jgi:tetratricopeptide (TPR) repeat protein
MKKQKPYGQIVSAGYFPYNLSKHKFMKYVAASALLGALLFLSACTQSPQKLVEAGNRYHARKKYTEASILYQKALTKDKTNAEAYYREGLNLLDAGDLTGAVGYLRRAVDLKPSNTDAASKLAELYLLAYANNPEKFKTFIPDIEELINKVLRYQPNSFNGARLQGLYALAKHDPERALEAFQRANQLKPYSPDVVTWYAESLYNAKRVDEAEALERDMLAHNKKWGPGYDFLFVLYSRSGQKEKAKTILEQRVNNDPTSAVAIENLANYDVLLGDYPAGEALARRVLTDPKAFPNRFQLLGDFYFRNRKFDQALQQYQTGIKEDSKNALVYKERIVSLDEATGRPQDALNLAHSIAKENPKNVQANERYASLLLQTGSREVIAKSLNEIRDLSKANPNNPLLRLDLARAYFDTEEFDKSISEAQEAMQQETKSAESAVPRRSPRPQLISACSVLIGRIEADRGQHAQALDQANRVLQMDPKFVDPKLIADAKLIKARAMVGLGQSDQALPELEALIQQYPRLGGARLELAHVYLVRKEFDKAAAEYEQFSKDFPTDLRGQVGLQSVKIAEGKADEGLSALEAMIAKSPKDLQLRYQLATFQVQAGLQALPKDRNRARQLYEQAANNYKEILKTTANSPDVWLRLGVLQRELGEKDAALASFQQASSADPHNSAPLLNEAMLLEDLGKKKEASATYSKVLGIDPENPLAMNNLAYLSAESGTNLDQAMTFAERAKQRLPNSPDISDTLGYVYYQKHLNDQALQIFKELVATHQDNPTFRLHLAMALEKSGEKGAARDEARKALQFATRPELQTQIKTFLNQLG